MLRFAITTPFAGSRAKCPSGPDRGLAGRYLAAGEIVSTFLPLRSLFLGSFFHLDKSIRSWSMGVPAMDGCAFGGPLPRCPPGRHALPGVRHHSRSVRWRTLPKEIGVPGHLAPPRRQLASLRPIRVLS